MYAGALPENRRQLALEMSNLDTIGDASIKRHQFPGIFEHRCSSGFSNYDFWPTFFIVGGKKGLVVVKYVHNTGGSSRPRVKLAWEREGIIM